MKNQRKAYFFAIAAVLCWSTVASAFKLSLRYLSYIELLTFSSFIASAALFLVLVVQKKLPLLRQLRLRNIAPSIFLGFLNPFLYYLILLKAYDILPAQEAMTLNYTWPVMLVLLSAPLLKQPIKLKSIIALLVSFIGILIIANKGVLNSFRLTNLFGDLLAIGSSVIWALYWLINVSDNREDTIKLFLNFSFGFVFSVVTLCFTTPLAAPALKGILGSIYIGLFEMGITFILWLAALKFSERTDKVSQLIFLSPFLSLFFIQVVVKEKILRSTIAGLVLIITGILLQQVRLPKSK